MNSAARPRIVFIHGAGGYKKRRKWRKPLNRALKRRGLEGWSKAETAKVKYMKELRGTKEPRSWRKFPDCDSPTSRKEKFSGYRGELDQIVERRRTKKPAKLKGVPDGPVTKTSRLVRISPFFSKSAKRYPRRRRAVCEKVLADIQGLGPGELIIIGHSLGSVVAADLLPRLPSDQHVRLLITLGSPLGTGLWKPTVEGLQKRFPSGQLDAWINIHNRRDLITGGRGLNPIIPEVIDVKIDRFPGNLHMGQHRVRHYLRHAAVIDAIEWACAPRAGDP